MRARGDVTGGAAKGDRARSRAARSAPGVCSILLFGAFGFLSQGGVLAASGAADRVGAATEAVIGAEGRARVVIIFRRADPAAGPSSETAARRRSDRKSTRLNSSHSS